jgi:Chaperone of endosialidase
LNCGTGERLSIRSPARLKANINAISGFDALQKLALIRGVTFNWADPTRPQIMTAANRDVGRGDGRQAEHSYAHERLHAGLRR